MPQISVLLLDMGDTEDILAFEQENRDWFERSVPPRADGYFHHDSLQEINRGLVAEAQNDTAYMFLIRDGAEQIIGRINLTKIQRGETPSAEIGYRIGERAAGQGVATAATGILATLARDVYGLSELRAACLESNPASFAVLTRNGFTEIPDARKDFARQGQPDVMIRLRKALL